MSTAPHAAAWSSERHTAEFGMYVFIASELLFFGALLLTYAYGRTQWPDGFAAAGRHTNVLLGTVNTAVLLTSSLCVALAAHAHAADRGRLARRLLAATILLGVAFLAIKGFEYHEEWHEGLFPGPAFRLDSHAAVPQGAQMFFAFYFVATGLHALHVACGIGWMALLARAMRRGRPVGGTQLHVAGLYWHFVDIVWIVLYPLLYLMGRSG